MTKFQYVVGTGFTKIQSFNVAEEFIPVCTGHKTSVHILTDRSTNHRFLGGTGRDWNQTGFESL